jgi:hypothetical protein
MGRDPNGAPKEKQNKRSNNSRPKVKSNGFIFTSFYPTKEQKAEISQMEGIASRFAFELQVLTEKGYKTTIKQDLDRDCIMLMVQENVPFGEPCKAISFWHSDVSMVMAQLCYWIATGYEAWASDDRALATQLEFDW